MELWGLVLAELISWRIVFLHPQPLQLVKHIHTLWETHFVKARLCNSRAGAQLVVEPWIRHSFIQIVVEEQGIQNHLQKSN